MGKGWDEVGMGMVWNGMTRESIKNGMGWDLDGMGKGMGKA